MTTTPVHSITDEQIAEIEDAAKTRHGVFGSHFMHDITTDEVLALITRLREAEKDAARYRWIADNASIETEEHGIFESESQLDTAMQGDK